MNPKQQAIKQQYLNQLQALEKFTKQQLQTWQQQASQIVNPVALQKFFGQINTWLAAQDEQIKALQEKTLSQFTALQDNDDRSERDRIRKQLLQSKP